MDVAPDHKSQASPAVRTVAVSQPRTLSVARRTIEFTVEA
jgi:hypothetical protein